MNLKKFNKKGNESYKILLQSSLNKNSLSNNDYEPFDILCKNKNLTEEVPKAKKIELKNFSNRFELGKYLNQVLSECKVSDFTQDECFWNWISCFYIRKILSSKGGKEIVRFQFTTSREGRRNLVRQPWLLYNINKEDLYKKYLDKSWFEINLHKDPDFVIEKINAFQPSHIIDFIILFFNSFF